MFSDAKRGIETRYAVTAEYSEHPPVGMKKVGMWRLRGSQ
jgi:hypothetical protein